MDAWRDTVTRHSQCARGETSHRYRELQFAFLPSGWKPFTCERKGWVTHMCLHSDSDPTDWFVACRLGRSSFDVASTCVHGGQPSISCNIAFMTGWRRHQKPSVRSRPEPFVSCQAHEVVPLRADLFASNSNCARAIMQDVLASQNTQYHLPTPSF